MVKAVTNSGGELEVYYKHREEELSVRLASSEAIEIRERAKISEREVSAPSGQRDVGYTLPGEGPGSPRFDVEYLADRVVAAGTEAEALIAAVASALQEAGMGHVLKTVAAKLDERGHHSLAMAVRASAHQRNRDSEPPERA